MDDFVDIDKVDLVNRINYLEKKVHELQKKSEKSKIRNIYDTTQNVYSIAYNAYIISQLSIPFWIFCKYYFNL